MRLASDGQSLSDVAVRFDRESCSPIAHLQGSDGSDIVAFEPELPSIASSICTSSTCLLYTFSSRSQVLGEVLCQSLVDIFKLLLVLRIIKISPSCSPSMMPTHQLTFRPEEDLHSIIMMILVLPAPFFLIHSDLDLLDHFFRFVHTGEET